MAGDEQQGIPAAEALELGALVSYGEHAVVSRTLVKHPRGSVTLFAFDQGQELSEHATPFDALAQVIDGEGEFVIGGRPVRVRAGSAVLMPGRVPHAVRAVARFKMLLVMLRGE